MHNNQNHRLDSVDEEQHIEDIDCRDVSMRPVRAELPKYDQRRNPWT